MAVFQEFNQSEDIITSNERIITDGALGDGNGDLTIFHTSSTQAAASSSNYYLDVYNTTSSEEGADRIFDISFGQYNDWDSYHDNTGSVYTDDYKPHKAIYGQYANIILGSNVADNKQFQLNSLNVDRIFIVNFSRAGIKESLDPGNWEMTLSGSSGSFTFCDTSAEIGSVTYDTPEDYLTAAAGEAFYVVSGSILEGVQDTGSFNRGIVYPRLGVIIFNAETIHTEVGLSTTTSFEGPDDYNKDFYDAMVLGANVQARNEESITSTHYFCRIKNSQFNFSNNPTWTTESANISGLRMKYDVMQGDPQVYITTIGLYDDEDQLLAVAKLNKPQLKNFQRELLVRVRVDY